MFDRFVCKCMQMYSNILYEKLKAPILILPIFRTVFRGTYLKEVAAILQGKVQVDFNFPTIIIDKMARLPFIPDLRYKDDKDLKDKSQRMLKSDVSYTHRAPYPSTDETGLPRYKMGS